MIKMWLAHHGFFFFTVMGIFNGIEKQPKIMLHTEQLSHDSTESRDLSSSAVIRLSDSRIYVCASDG